MNAGAPAADATASAPVRRALRWLTPLLVAHGGLFLGLASPQLPNHFAWPIALVPILLALDLTLRRHHGGPAGFWLRVAACTYPAGVVFAAVTGDWVTNTAFVFGHMPRPLALLTNWFGYGTLHGLELFAFVGVPFALAWRRPWLLLVLVPLWCTVGQLFVPRFLFFTYGQAMVTVPALVQFADVLGSGGVNLLYIGLQMALYLWVRRLYDAEPLPLRPLLTASGVVAGLFVAALAYGLWSESLWAERQRQGRVVELLGIQPNFTLAHLASNRARTHSDRQQSLRALLDDSAAALRQSTAAPDVPRVLLWPESVYPRAYFVARGMREVVELWVRHANAHLVLTSVDYDVRRTPGAPPERQAYGAAIHVGPDGASRGVYRKIALIPFGERVPLGDVLPGWRRLLRANISNLSEFKPGGAYTTFTLDNGVQLAPMICFDAADPTVARGMAANGARVGVVLANLAWFGATSVTDQFAWFARFRAIENRMPLLFLSQNGSSFLIDAAGRIASPRLAQYERGVLAVQVGVPTESAFYTHYAPVVRAAYALLLALVLALLVRQATRERTRR